MNNNKREDILKSLANKANNDGTYKDKVKYLNTKARYEYEAHKEDSIQAILDLQRSHGIKPKERATFEELSIMFAMVLETGQSGTKVIREYAKQNNKSNEWVKDIAKPHPNKLIRLILEQHDDDLTIRSLKANKVYKPKDIYNKSVTGALTKLSEQIALSRKLDKGKEEIVELKSHLELKEALSKQDKIDWAEAQRLRDSGMTIRKVADIIGASPSAVGKYTIKR